MTTIDKGTAELPLIDESGASRPFRDLWRDGTVVIAFLRHYG